MPTKITYGLTQIFQKFIIRNERGDESFHQIYFAIQSNPTQCLFPNTFQLSPFGTHMSPSRQMSLATWLPFLSSPKTSEVALPKSVSINSVT